MEIFPVVHTNNEQKVHGSRGALFLKQPVVIFVERKRLKPENIDCTPPDYIMPGCKDRPLLPVMVISKENTVSFFRLQPIQTSGLKKKNIFFLRIFSV